MSQYILGPATTQIELQKNIPLGIAGLDSSAKVSSNQLPSYVDDVLEYNSMSFFPAEGESGKIYIAKDTNITYRWSGSSYVPIGSDLALGETSSTAYRGDRGATAYAHATDENKVVTAYPSGLYKMAVTAAGHIASAVPVEKSDITSLGIPAQDTTYSVMTGATSSSSGTSGLVPIPTSGEQNKFLKADGTWAYYDVMTGATSEAAGTSGLVPAPAASNAGHFLRGDGTWVQCGKPMVVLSYGSSTWQDFINAYNSNAIVYCRASSNSNPATGEQLRMAFMAYISGNATAPTGVEFQYYRSVSSHSANQQGDQVFVYKLESTNGGTWSVTTREASSKIVVGSNLTSTYGGGVLTIDGNYSAFTGATSSVAGTAGLVPAPTTSDVNKFLKSNGTWAEIEGSHLYKIPFAITTADWTLTQGTYVASVISPHFVTASEEFVIYDSTLSNLEGNLYTEKDVSTTSMVFTTSALPHGTISGNIYSILPNNGQIAITFLNEVVPISSGGTGANSLAGAKTNLGIVQMVGATSNDSGATGMVPAPSAGDDSKYLKGDGTWSTIASASDMTGATSGTAGTHGLVPAPSAGDNRKYLKGDGTWSVIENVAPIESPDFYYSISMGRKSNTSCSRGSVAVGNEVTASANYAHAEGNSTTASAESAHAEGDGTTASGTYSHAEGRNTTASNSQAHAEGLSSTASGISSHAEGNYVSASGNYSHAEGANTTASGNYSHVEGSSSVASGNYCHAEGSTTKAIGNMSHAGGSFSEAGRYCAFVHGHKVKAYGDCAFAFGKWNIQDIPNWVSGTSYAVGDNVVNDDKKVCRCKIANSDTVFTESNWYIDVETHTKAEIVGGGDSDYSLKNIRTLDWSGDEHLKGDLYVGANDDGTGGTQVLAKGCTWGALAGASGY